MNNEKNNSSARRGPGPGHGRVGMNTEKAKDLKGTVKKLIKYLSEYKLSIILVVIFSIFASIFSIMGPDILGNATTEIANGLFGKVVGTSTGINFDKIFNILIRLTFLYAISAIFSFLQGYIMAGISHKVSYKLRHQISEKIHRIPFKYFEQKTTGEILSRITNDVDTLSQNLSQSLSQAVSSIIMIIGILIMMLSISPLMTGVTIIILPLSFGLIIFVMAKSQKFFREQQEYLGHINSRVEETYGGHSIVKVFNADKEAIQKFNEINNTLYKSAWKSQFFSGLMMPIMSFIGNLGYVIASILGGYLTIKKKIEVGDILAFTQYIRQFNNQASQVTQIGNLIQSTAAAAERVFEFLDEKEEIEVEENPIDVNKLIGNITFSNVSFGYDKDKEVIHDFSIQIKKGQKIAIVGPTGAGKTTIVKLLMRFYDVNKGSINIDEYNINEFKRSDLRSLFGMVLQDTWLFNGKIIDNIRYGKLDAKDSDVKEAAEAAYASHFIKTLPDGYNMVIDEEATNISQGQKQLLTIARVILADPKILILDEATSSVDTRTEILIQNAMDKLMEGRTSFIIAHRLSTIKNADLILVMNNGDIVETGNHNNLLKKDGFYAKLYNSQFEE